MYRDSKRRKLDHSKYESLNETPASITAQKPLENFNSSSSTVASEQMTQCSICQQSMSTSQYIEHIQIVHGTENGTGTSDGGNKLRNVRSFFSNIMEDPSFKNREFRHPSVVVHIPFFYFTKAFI